MCRNAKKKPKDASTGDATAAAQPQGNPDDRPKSILPPPDPKLDGTQKRGFGVFRRGPGAA
jgi:hypothetical protein